MALVWCVCDDPPTVPRCTFCARAIPDGVDWFCTGDGSALCLPCVQDDYTPDWRQHLGHVEPVAECAICDDGEVPGTQDGEREAGT